jgi:tetratricopeptide (TPR) repeat protein
MSSFYGITSRGHWAAYYAGLARKISANFHDLPAQAALAVRFTLYHGALGQWEQAVAEAQQALRWYQQLEDRRTWGDCLAILAIIALLRGHFREGLTHGAALQTLAAGNYNIEHQSWAICGQALNLLHLGRTEEALALATELTPLLNQGKRITLHVRAAYYKYCRGSAVTRGKKGVGFAGGG